jgi:hypothetical protein
MPNGQSKDSDTAAYSGIPDNTQTDGLVQTGGFKSTPPSVSGLSVEVLEGLPAAVRVQLTTNNGIVQTGSPQQYAVKVALNGTLQLTPLMANAQNQLVVAAAPNVFNYVFSSRNVKIATVDANGLVTAVGRGECEILIGNTRQVAASFVGATPPAGETGASAYAFLNVTVTP